MLYTPRPLKSSTLYWLLSLFQTHLSSRLLAPFSFYFTVWHPFLQPDRPRLLTVCVSHLFLLCCLTHMLLQQDAQRLLAVCVSLLFLLHCLTHTCFCNQMHKDYSLYMSPSSYFAVWHMLLKPDAQRLLIVPVSIFLFCCLTHASATRCTKTCCMTKTTHHMCLFLLHCLMHVLLY